MLKYFYFWSFLCCIKIQYDFFFSFQSILGRMHENKDMFLFFMFWWKPGILIPDLYFYGIKIQPDINQNGIEKCARKSQFFPKWVLNIFWTGPTRSKKRLGWNQPKIKLGQDRPKREPCCGWTQPSRVGWADVPTQKTNSGLLCMPQ